MQSHNLQRFHGTWNLIVQSCVYEHAAPPTSAQHVISAGKYPNQLHVSVTWQEKHEDKPRHFEYDITVDGQAHKTNYNSADLNVTAKQVTSTVQNDTLHVIHESPVVVVDWKCCASENRIHLNMKNLIDGKWLNLKQTYKR